MNSYAVYSKTGKGVQEAGGKTSELSRAERAVLAAIDGRLTVDQLREQFPKSSEDALHALLERLEQEGYIRLVMAGQSPSQGARLPAGRTSPLDAGTDLDFSSIAPASAPRPAPPPARSDADAFAKARAEAEARAQAARDAERERERAAERARYGPSKEELAAEAAAKAAREKAAAEAAAREKHAAEARERAAAAARAKVEAEARVRAQSEAAMKAAAEARAKAQAETEAKLKATREAAVRAAVEAKLRAEAEANTRLEAERRAREDLEQRLKELERRLATETAKPAVPVDRGLGDSDALRRQLDELLRSRGAGAAPTVPATGLSDAELLARRQAEDLQRKLDAERRAREGEEARQRAEAEALLQKLDAERRAREEDEARQRAEAEALLRKLEAERRAREEEERRVREEEEARRRAEAEVLVQKMEAERLEKEEQERRLREEVERNLREQDEARKRADVEALQQKLEEQRRVREEEEHRARDEEDARRRKAEAAVQRVEDEREAKLRIAREAEERRLQAEAERIRQEQERAMREADELAQRKEAERQKALEEAERRKREETQALFAGLNEFAGRAPAPAAPAATPAQESTAAAQAEPDLDFSGVVPSVRETEKKSTAAERPAAAEKLARVEGEAHSMSKPAGAPAVEKVQPAAPSMPAAKATGAPSSRKGAKEEVRARPKPKPHVEEPGLAKKVGVWMERFARKRDAGKDIQSKERREKDSTAAQDRAPASVPRSAPKEDRAPASTPRPAPKEDRAPSPAASAEAVKPPPAARVPRAAPVKWGSLFAKGMLALVVLAVAGIHVVPVSVEAVESEASEAFGTPVKIGSARWWFLTGPELRFADVKLGDRGTIPLVRVMLRVEDLVSGKFVPERLEIEGASLPQAGFDRVLFGTAGDRRLRGLRVLARDTKFSGPLVLPPVNAEVLVGADGRVQSATLRGADALLVKASVRGREVTLDATGGKLAVPFLPRIELADFSFKGTATAQGINIREWDGRLLDGVLRGSARVSWGAGWSVSGDIGAKAINAGLFAPALVSEGRGVGQATYSLSASRISDLAASARLQGKFEIGRARLAGMDLMRTLESGGTQVAGSMMLESLKGDFIYERGAASLKNIALDVDNGIRASGSLDIASDGALRGSLAVARPLSRGGVQQASINLGGTLKEPRPQP